MGDTDSGTDGWLRASARRGSRRQSGLLGASLLAALAATEPAAGRGKQRSASARIARACRGRRRCGGITGKPCPKGLVCIDDPNDDCDPDNGGADCGGICVPRTPRSLRPHPLRRGHALLPPLRRALPGAEHPLRRGGVPPRAMQRDRLRPRRVLLQRVLQPCAPLGGACTDEVCPPPGERCGRAVCGENEYCCAPHCHALHPDRRDVLRRAMPARARSIPLRPKRLRRRRILLQPKLRHRAPHSARIATRPSATPTIRRWKSAAAWSARLARSAATPVAGSAPRPAAPAPARLRGRAGSLAPPRLGARERRHDGRHVAAHHPHVGRRRRSPPLPGRRCRGAGPASPRLRRRWRTSGRGCSTFSAKIAGTPAARSPRSGAARRARRDRPLRSRASRAPCRPPRTRRRRRSSRTCRGR